MCFSGARLQQPTQHGCMKVTPPKYHQADPGLGRSRPSRSRNQVYPRPKSRARRTRHQADPGPGRSSTGPGRSRTKPIQDQANPGSGPAPEKRRKNPTQSQRIAEKTAGMTELAHTTKSQSLVMTKKRNWQTRPNKLSNSPRINCQTPAY